MLNKQDLSLNELMVFSSELKRNEKSAAIAYLMLLGGHLGLHRFYLKRKWTAVIQLLLFIMASIFYLMMYLSSAIGSDGLIIASIILFALSAIALFIWIVVDLFLLPRMIKEFNGAIERDILSQMEHYRTMEQLSGRSVPSLIKE
ncbi:NINE protein [Paenibacillus solisilvae]|uniref:NINE protein n=1 Tax=Paenibacillus solisilvae TaxID=2486751 RepID=A0ABW0W7R7_9BACL